MRRHQRFHFELRPLAYEHTRRAYLLPLSLFSFMLRVVFASHCVARRACRPVTLASQFKGRQDKTSEFVNCSSSFSGGRSPTSTYGIRLPPFGLSASRRLTRVKRPPPPTVPAAFPHPPFCCFPLPNPLFSTQSNPNPWHNRRSGLTSRLPTTTGERALHQRQGQE